MVEVMIWKTRLGRGVPTLLAVMFGNLAYNIYSPEPIGEADSIWLIANCMPANVRTSAVVTDHVHADYSIVGFWYIADEWKGGPAVL